MNVTLTQPVPAVSARGLRKYFGPVRAVDDIDVDIPAGQIVALLGANGAGKTTTLEMLLGLSKPDTGTVELFGVPPRRALDAGDVGAMLQIGDLIRGAKVAELLRAFSALYRQPLPLETVIERAGLTGLLAKRTDKLSGGESQRVRFGLALIGDPKLLVLDEPTVGLDVGTRREFWTHVRNYARSGGSVLFSTHYLEEVDENADIVIVIASGRIVASGPAASIRSTVVHRIIRCTVPGVQHDALMALPGVESVEADCELITIRSTDSDATMHALLPAYPQTRDIEVVATSLSDAFLALTASPPDGLDPDQVSGHGTTRATSGELR